MRERRLLAGTLAVALILAGTRWASYIGTSPLFLTDALVGMGTIGYSIERLVNREALPQREVRPKLLLVWLLLIWCGIRFTITPSFSTLALRDLAPYAYSLLALLAAWSLRYVTTTGLARTRRCLMGALWGHAVWFTAAQLVPSVQGVLPFPGDATQASVFMPRPDIDSAVNAVFITVLVVRAVTRRTRHPWLALFVAAAASTPIFSTGARSGFLALGATLTFGFVAAFAASGTKRKLGLITLIPLFVSLAMLFLPQTTVGERLSGTFGGTTTSSASAQAAGTAGARTNAWGALTRWITEDPDREVIGVGFGENFMLNSGAIYRLIGTDNPLQDVVRSPHDYWLGTWARLGLVGLAITVMISFTLLYSIWGSRKVVAHDELRLIACLVTLSILIIGTVGVVLEAPFGAVPFWWCAGIVLAWPRELGQDPGAGLRARGESAELDELVVAERRGRRR